MSTETKISICNHALTLIGDRNISSFDEGTATAERCSSLYDTVCKSVLRDHPWSCAKSRAVLSPKATHPVFGYAHAFPLPSNFIRVIDAGVREYEIENRHILANTDKINLTYIFDNDNEDTWDSMLIEAVALKLASKLAKPNTGSDAAGQSALAEYERLIKKARLVNAQERPPQRLIFEGDGYLSERY